MLVECTVHTGGARFITTRLLASPVQSFLSKAVDFSLAFPFSSISTYRTSQSQPYRVCQTWLQRARSELRASEVESALWPPRVPSGARQAQLYARSYANEVTSPARPLNSFAPGFVSGTASGACMAFGGGGGSASTHAPSHDEGGKIKHVKRPIPAALPS